tara:strand:- start:14 stop:319 length:306 start_codon:yes stop_codon:yes gene_type:complete
MNRILLILLLLAPSTLHAASKPKVKVKDIQPSATFIDVGGHLLVESSGIVTVWIDSWPPPKTNADKEANFLITKALSAGVRSGKIKLKKPPLTPEQRAKRR